MFESQFNRHLRFASYGFLALWLVAVVSVLLLETTPLELNETESKAIVYLTAILGLPVVFSLLAAASVSLIKRCDCYFRHLSFGGHLSCWRKFFGRVVRFCKVERVENRVRRIPAQEQT